MPGNLVSAITICRRGRTIPSSVYQTPKGYYVDDQDVEAFDRQFPPKEKLKLPGQLFD